MAFMDTQTIETAAQLQQGMIQWWSMSGGPKFQKGNSARTSTRSSTKLTCYNCGKPGHRASECRSRQSPVLYSRPESQQQYQQRKKECFKCGSTEHLAYACPGKTKTNTQKTPVKERATANKVDVNPQRKGEMDAILGNVGMHETPFVLDSGASISVVPDDLVCAKERTGEFIHVSDANGGEMRRPVAIVELQVGKLKCKQRVAVAPKADLKDGTLLAIDLDVEEHFQLLVDYRECGCKRA